MADALPSLLVADTVRKLVNGMAKDQSITPEQRRLAELGDAEAFWKARKAVGDPVARFGLASLHPKTDPMDTLFGGKSINDRLEAFSRVYAGRSADIPAIRQDLIRAHVAAVDADRTGHPGRLTPGQITDYHHEVLEKYGLPSTTFGGTPFSGSKGDIALTYPLWAWGTDSK
jgi:hypothetical protein